MFGSIFKKILIVLLTKPNFQIINSINNILSNQLTNSFIQKCIYSSQKKYTHIFVLFSSVLVQCIILIVQLSLVLNNYWIR